MKNNSMINIYFYSIRLSVGCLLFLMIQLVAVNANSATILGASPENQQPVHSSQAASPSILLTVSRDHSMSFPAYNDMTDLDGVGTIDIMFKPSFTYLGLFNSKYCYSYNNTGNLATSYFFPAATANPLDRGSNRGGCVPGQQYWSGNWLNYVTTSRMDAMRVALYGGMREIDLDATHAEPLTILRRAYIPQDGHGWAKDYANSDLGTYDIQYYAPLTTPGNDAGTPLYHLFGNLTSTVRNGTTHQLQTYLKPDGSWVQAYAPGPFSDTPTTTVADVGIECSTLSDCSGYPPLLRVIKKSGNPAQRWASSQRPVLDARPYPIGYVGQFTSASHPNARGNMVGYGNLGDTPDVLTSAAPVLTDYAVRVQVCSPGYTDGCQPYTHVVSGVTYTTYKPTGVLQEYGADGSVNFGLLTGSYDNNLSGGRLRTPVGPFSTELNTNGTFARPAYSLISHLDSIRISNYNVSTYTGLDPGHNQLVVPNYSNYYFGNNFIYKDTWTYGLGDHIAKDGVLPDGKVNDWGNPLAEMMYEGLRYYANAGKTPAFNIADDEDYRVFGNRYINQNWTDPYQDPTKWCSKPNIMVVSGPNPSWDSDQLPGSPFNSAFAGSLSNAAGAPLNVGNETLYIGNIEGINGTSKFIGENNNVDTWQNKDRNPTLKNNVSMEKIRGLVPDQTDNQGSFLSAGVAYWAKKGALRTVGGNNIPTVDTYVMLLNDPFPSIKIPFPGKNTTVTIMPFGKTQDTTAPTTLADQTTNRQYMPTNQLVGVYPTLLTDPQNTGAGFHLVFYANFEDHAWGGDFEMDVVIRYEIQAFPATGQLTVSMSALDQNGNLVQNLGYVITGTTVDGPYMELQSFVPQTTPTPPAAPVPISYPFYLNTPHPGPTPFPPGHCAVNANFTLDRCGQLSAGSTSRTFIVANNYNQDNELKNPLWYAARWGGYKVDEPTGPLPTGTTPDHYIQVLSVANLKVAFQKMIQSALNNGATVGSVTTSSQALKTSTQLFTTSYNTTNGVGELSAITFSVTPSDTISYTNYIQASTGVASTYFSSRKIYYQRKNNTIPNGTVPIVFNESNVNTSATAGWPGTFASGVINYLLGQQSEELKNGGSMQNRITLLGPAVNSMPVYSPYTGDVYVGMNDGMLHAFKASDLSEQFGYVPKQLITTLDSSGKSILNSLSVPGSPWRYTMDGNIAISSISQQDGNMNSTSNYLIAFLGRGGRGLFGLEIDSSTHTPVNSWEYSSVSASDNNLGYLLGQPIIEQLSDGTTVAIFGNGYDSISKKAALYVVKLSDGTVIQRYLTNAGSTLAPNGLATPGIVRENGKATYAYAGDYLGNVWKFKLPVNSTPALDITYSTNSAYILKLFTTLPGQPIVAPITVKFSDDSTDDDVKNKQFVFFGTGSDLTATATDFNSTVQQTMYGLIDGNTGTSPFVAVNQSNLVARTLSTTPYTFTGYTPANLTLNVRTIASPIAHDMVGKDGWYMNWFNSASAGGGPSEKVFSAAAVQSAIVPTLVVSSSIANSNSCVTTGAGYLNAMDAYHGGGLNVNSAYFDINRNRQHDDNVSISGGTQSAISSIDFGIGAIGQAGFTGSNVIVQGSGPNTSKATDNIADVGTFFNAITSRRTSWREITN